MVDDNSPTDTTTEPTEQAPPRRRRAAKRPAGPPPVDPETPTAAADPAAAPATDASGRGVADPDAGSVPAAPAKKAAKRAPRKRTAAAPVVDTPAPDSAVPGAPAPDAAATGTPAPDAAAPEATQSETVATEPAAAEPAPARKTTKRAPRKKAAAATPPVADEEPATPQDTDTEISAATESAAPLFSAPDAAPAPTRRRRVTKKAAAPDPEAQTEAQTESATAPIVEPATPAVTAAPMFQAPDPAAAPVRRRTRKAASKTATQPEATGAPEQAQDDATTATDELVEPVDAEPAEADAIVATLEATDAVDEDAEQPDEDTDEETDGPSRRRRRRGGRRRRRSGSGDADAGAEAEEAASPDESPAAEDADEDGADADETTEGGTTRRRRRRRRRGEGVDLSPDDPANTVVRVREPRSSDDEITSISGSTRLEAKKQRRREGRDAGRRRAPIVSEAEFLARRESVKREMIIRQRDGISQIAVLEDSVLVEHYVARESQTSLIGNVYLGRVQNVLPSMEAAFVDIGKGRNAVLYAGEVDWKALGVEGRPRKVEEVLKSGQTILVQVTKDPVGHKGARLTGQISLPGRYVVYVPGGQSSGISRKLSDTERSRLKSLLKQILPEEAGVIIRTAAEGATEEQLTRDVGALTARWDDIAKKAQAGGAAPQLLYGEPDLMIKVVRDLFNEDFASLLVEGADAWDMIEGYVAHVAPDLGERLSRWGDGSGDHRDVFSAHRIDEQIAKGLDRKVWLPSGGSLIIDRTEAMTVVDVNTGKFTGSGGNLEETVTKNNLEAAEEIVRQLRLRDIGGIIVIDFIDMVLENNRDLVLRRLVECLGRDRTRHQVAEVTSLGLVQMTRKKIGTGLLEAFSETCEHCHGRGLTVHAEPIETARRNGSGEDGGNGSGGSGGGEPGEGGGRGRGRRGGRGRAGRSDESDDASATPVERPTNPIPPALRPETLREVPGAEPVVAQPAAASSDGDRSTAQPSSPVAESTPGSVTEAAPESTTEPAPESTTEPAPESVAEPAAAAAPAVDVHPEPAAPAAEQSAGQSPGQTPPAAVADVAPVAPPKRTRRRASRPAAPPAPAADEASPSGAAGPR